MQFEAHGDYELWVHKNVIFGQLFGSWNKQAAKKFAYDFKSLASNFDGTWGHYVDLTQWQLCGNEVFEVIEELVAWCIDNGMLRAAQVYPSSIIKAQFIDQMVVEQQGLFKRAVFSDPEQACLWLSSEGFQARVNP